MILETAEFRVTDGPAFEAAVREAKPLFLSSPGCEGLALHRVLEEPGLYHLLVRWRSLEDHTETFRNSPAFPRWRALVSRFFAEAPRVTHSEEAPL